MINEDNVEAFTSEVNQNESSNFPESLPIPNTDYYDEDGVYHVDIEDDAAVTLSPYRMRPKVSRTKDDSFSKFVDRGVTASEAHYLIQNAYFAYSSAEKANICRLHAEKNGTTCEVLQHQVTELKKYVATLQNRIVQSSSEVGEAQSKQREAEEKFNELKAQYEAVLKQKMSVLSENREATKWHQEYEKSQTVLSEMVQAYSNLKERYSEAIKIASDFSKAKDEAISDFQNLEVKLKRTEFDYNLRLTNFNDLINSFVDLLEKNLIIIPNDLKTKLEEVQNGETNFQEYSKSGSESTVSNIHVPRNDDLLADDLALSESSDEDLDHQVLQVLGNSKENSPVKTRRNSPIKKKSPNVSKVIQTTNEKSQISTTDFFADQPSTPTIHGRKSWNIAEIQKENKNKDESEIVKNFIEQTAPSEPVAKKVTPSLIRKAKIVVPSSDVEVIVKNCQPTADVTDAENVLTDSNEASKRTVIEDRTSDLVSNVVSSVIPKRIIPVRRSSARVENRNPQPTVDVTDLGNVLTDSNEASKRTVIEERTSDLVSNVVSSVIPKRIIPTRRSSTRVGNRNPQPTADVTDLGNVLIDSNEVTIKKKLPNLSKVTKKTTNQKASILMTKSKTKQQSSIEIFPVNNVTRSGVNKGFADQPSAPTIHGRKSRTIREIQEENKNKDKSEILKNLREQMAPSQPLPKKATVSVIRKAKIAVPSSDVETRKLNVSKSVAEDTVNLPVIAKEAQPILNELESAGKRTRKTTEIVSNAKRRKIESEDLNPILELKSIVSKYKSSDTAIKVDKFLTWAPAKLHIKEAVEILVEFMIDKVTCSNCFGLLSNPTEAAVSGDEERILELCSQLSQEESWKILISDCFCLFAKKQLENNTRMTVLQVNKNYRLLFSLAEISFPNAQSIPEDMLSSLLKSLVLDYSPEAVITTFCYLLTISANSVKKFIIDRIIENDEGFSDLLVTMLTHCSEEQKKIFANLVKTNAEIDFDNSKLDRSITIDDYGQLLDSKLGQIFYLQNGLNSCEFEGEYFISFSPEIQQMINLMTALFTPEMFRDFKRYNFLNAGLDFINCALEHLINGDDDLELNDEFFDKISENYYGSIIVNPGKPEAVANLVQLLYTICRLIFVPYQRLTKSAIKNSDDQTAERMISFVNLWQKRIENSKISDDNLSKQKLFFGLKECADYYERIYPQLKQ